MEISSSVVLPVTDDQMQAFKSWIMTTYGTYHIYMGAMKDPAMDAYIKEHLLPAEMKSALRFSEPYIGEKHGDIHIKRLLLNRGRVMAKIKNMKGKIGTLTFPVESALARRINRDAATDRRDSRTATILHAQQVRAEYIAHMEATYEERVAAVRERNSVNSLPDKFTIVRVQIVMTAPMDEDCAICMGNHTMSEACMINDCGHQFGRECLTKWTSLKGTSSCPLCRKTVTEISEFRLL